MMKRVVSAMLALVLLLGMPLTARAHDVPQDRDNCTIEVQVRYDGENVSGGTLTAIKVGYVDEDDGNYFFSRVMDDTLLEDISSAEAVQELLKFYKDNKTQHAFEQQTVSVKDGIAKFSGLPTGLYLILQNKAAKGYSKLNAFLVSIPYMEDGEYIYDVTAAIKTELEREPEPTEPKPTKPEGPKLPQTGQLNWPVPLLAVCGLALVVLGCFLRSRKKEYYGT